MSELDQALQAYLEDDKEQPRYYELILKSDFYIPLVADEEDLQAPEPESVRPLVLEADGKTYMPMFDSEERLAEWAKKPMPFVILAGFAAATISTPELHWAVNLGSEFAKEFVPQEIRWLRKLVEER